MTLDKLILARPDYNDRYLYVGPQELQHAVQGIKDWHNLTKLATYLKSLKEVHQIRLIGSSHHTTLGVVTLLGKELGITPFEEYIEDERSGQPFPLIAATACQKHAENADVIVMVSITGTVGSFLTDFARSHGMIQPGKYLSLEKGETITLDLASESYTIL